MRRALLLLTCLGFAGGCASTREAFTAYFWPKEKSAQQKPVSGPAMTKAEREKLEYERDPKEYMAKQNSKSLWKEGYGFNNPNGDIERRRSENKSSSFMMGPKYPVPDDPLPP